MRTGTRRLRFLTLTLVLALGAATPALAGAGPPVCSDGFIDGNETCDDGNTADGDGCSSECIAEICGDGVIESNGEAPDEECDDGNTRDADGCMGDCTCGPCGDGVQCGDEVCDDGNTVNDDLCSNECGYFDRCGNGLVDSELEECDDGNTVVGDGCDLICQIEPPDPHPPSKADQACVNAVNKAWAGVIRAANKAGGKCLKKMSSGKVIDTFDDCAEAADLGRAFSKTAKADQKKCVTKIDAAMFGYVGDSASINMAARTGALGAQTDLLGNPANVFPKADKVHARCQREVHKGLLRYLDSLAADANRAKKLCLKGKKVAQCQTPDALASAMTADGSKATHALPRWSVRSVIRCADTSETVATLFPGVCATAESYEELVSCAAQRAKCRFCASLNAADGLAVDCAGYANDPAGCSES